MQSVFLLPIQKDYCRPDILFLFCVSTIGYGDVGPANHEERLYTMFVAITGVIIFAFAMGNVTTIMQNTVGARSKFDERLRQVGEYLHFREVKPMLKRRILAHFGTAVRNDYD